MHQLCISLKYLKYYQFVIVEREFNDSIWIAAVIDRALKEEKSRAIIIKERSCVSFDFLINLIDQEIQLFLFFRTDAKILNSLHPLTQRACANALSVTSDKCK